MSLPFARYLVMCFAHGLALLRLLPHPPVPHSFYYELDAWGWRTALSSPPVLCSPGCLGSLLSDSLIALVMRGGSVLAPLAIFAPYVFWFCFHRGSLRLFRFV